MSAMPITIRDACPEDLDDWLKLWSAYLAFYQTELADKVTMSTWNRIMDPMSPVCMRLAIRNLDVAGFAIHHRHVSTWKTQPICYLEDLFVDPQFRGEGIGGGLIDDLIELCRRDGVAGLYWHTAENNAVARSLYDVYAKADGFVTYRIGLED